MRATFDCIAVACIFCRLSLSTKQCQAEDIKILFSGAYPWVLELVRRAANLPSVQVIMPLRSLSLLQLYYRHWSNQLEQIDPLMSMKDHHTDVLWKTSWKQMYNTGCVTHSKIHSNPQIALSEVAHCLLVVHLLLPGNPVLQPISCASAPGKISWRPFSCREIHSCNFCRLVHERLEVDVLSSNKM